MATTLTITTNYVGEFAGELFVEAFKKMSAIDNGAVTIYEDVNAPLYLRKLAQEDSIPAILGSTLLAILVSAHFSTIFCKTFGQKAATNQALITSTPGSLILEIAYEAIIKAITLINLTEE